MPQLGFLVPAPNESHYDCHDPDRDPLPEDLIQSIESAVTQSIIESGRPDGGYNMFDSYSHFREIPPGEDVQTLHKHRTVDADEPLHGAVPPEHASNIDVTSVVFDEPTTIHRVTSGDQNGHRQISRYLDVQQHERAAALGRLIDAAADLLPEDYTLGEVRNGDYPEQMKQETLDGDLLYELRQLRNTARGGRLLDLCGYSAGRILLTRDDVKRAIDIQDDEHTDIYLVDVYAKL
jgi:hypothetical protein